MSPSNGSGYSDIVTSLRRLTSSTIDAAKKLRRLAGAAARDLGCIGSGAIVLVLLLLLVLLLVLVLGFGHRERPMAALMKPLLVDEDSHFSKLVHANFEYEYEYE